MTRRRERIADAVLCGLIAIGLTVAALAYFDLLWRT